MNARHRVVQEIDALKPVRFRHRAALSQWSLAVGLAWDEIDVLVNELNPGDPRLNSYRDMVWVI